jgi:hypothetical protein
VILPLTNSGALKNVDVFPNHLIILTPVLSLKKMFTLRNKKIIEDFSTLLGHIGSNILWGPLFSLTNHSKRE